MSHSNSGSSAQAIADLEASNELRALQAEMASRQQKLDDIKADEALAAKKLADAEIASKPAVVAAPAILAWQPAETLTADGVRLGVATFGRSVLAILDEDAAGSVDLDALGSLVRTFEQGQLLGMFAALEKGAGIKAAPRHSDDCLKVRAFMLSMSMAVVCAATCPMVGYKPPVVRTASTAATGTVATVTSNQATGHSLGNVAYNGATGATDSISCKGAAALAVIDYPQAAILLKALANPKQNFRPVLVKSIKAGEVPAGTFGVSIVVEMTEEEVAA